MMKRLLQKTDKSQFNAFSIAAVLGLHLVSGIAVGSIAGYFLDKWLHTTPWCTLVLMICGIIAGFKNVYTDAKRLIALQEPQGRKKP